MLLRPNEKINCFYILTMGMEAYLSDKEPSGNMDSTDADQIYREIVEGVYYPFKDSEYIDGKKIAGFFYSKDEEECLTFYNNEFFTDGEWKPLSLEFEKLKVF